MPDPVTKEAMQELLADHAQKADASRAELKAAHKNLDEKINNIVDQEDRRGKETSEAKEAFQKQVEVVERVEKDIEALAEKLQRIHASGSAANEGKSVAEYLDEKKSELESYRSNNSGLVLLEHDGPLEQKATVDSSATTSVGLLIQPLRRPGFLTEPEEPLWIRDLLPTLSISTNAVEWVVEKPGSFTNGAAIQENEGDQKGEAGPPTYEEMSDTVKTIAHWIPITRQAMSDLPLLRSLIEQKMVRGLREVEEQQLLYGAGTGGNMLGIVPQASEYDVSKTVIGDSMVDQVRRMVLQARLRMYPVDSVVLNPTEWAAIELMKTDDKAYLFSNPTSGAPARLWGKTVVESAGMTQGEFLAGGFRLGATLWDREQITIRIAEQHADFFTKNMVALLVEERIMLTVERPQAFVKGTFVPPGGAA